MKYVIIIPDGAADFPLYELGGRTPFEAANMPYTDQMSLEGRLGTSVTTPKGKPCGSDVCSLSLLGYDPLRYHRGRAPLEAAALGLDLSPTDWIFRVNFVTALEGKMLDHSAGHISDQEGRALVDELISVTETYVPGGELFVGVSYRNIWVDRSGRDWSRLVTMPPHDIPGESVKKNLPRSSPDAEQLVKWINASEAILGASEINKTRRELGELPATHIWPWGQGQKPDVPSFDSRFGLKGAMITAVDLLAGIAGFIGWDRLDVPGQTSYHDTDYVQAGEHTIKALDDYDIVCVHIEAPDEAAHAADAQTKVASLEAMDTHIVGPILKTLKTRREPSRILYMPDHYTLVSNRKHDPTPVPFVMWGEGLTSELKMPFSEKAAESTDLKIAHGHELMSFFIEGAR